MRPFTDAGRLAWALPLAFAAAVAVASAGNPVAAQTPAESVFGDWRLVCGDVPDASRQCAITQRVAAEDRGGVWLDAYVFKPVEDANALILSILVPLRVILTKRLGVSIDNAQIQWFDFRSCSTEGCVVPIQLADAMRQELRLGGEALFIIFFEDEAGIGIPVSLTGFSAGVDALP
jgi:invasion protein IalB